jgi:uncharacterized membrane protein
MPTKVMKNILSILGCCLQVVFAIPIILGIMTINSIEWFYERTHREKPAKV